MFQPKSEETRRLQGSGVIKFMRRRPPPLVLWYSGTLVLWQVGHVDRPMLGLRGVPRCQLTLECHG